MSDRTVAVLAGGLSHEREVSLRSGRRLAGALRANGVDVREWDVDARLLERLSTDRPDAVGVALHGGEGENGAVQQVLELLGIPFVGTPSGACRRAWDKPSVKTELVRAGLSTPDWVALPPVEVEVPSGFYDYTSRYTPGAATFHCPARLPSDVLDALADTALAAHRLLGMRDVSRTDAIVDAAGHVHVLEMNVSPGLTDTSLLPTAVSADGSDLATVYLALVERAAARQD